MANVYRQISSFMKLTYMTGGGTVTQNI